MSKTRKPRSLEVRFSTFIAAVVVWFAAVTCWFEYVFQDDSLTAHLTVSGVLLAVAVIVTRIAARIFVRPLVLLEQGMASVREGRLEPLRISSSGDEIERLATGFDQMIHALAEARRLLTQQQQELELKVVQRTRALDFLRKQAEQAARAKGAFLANMSHELRTPLTGVLGMLDLVMDADLQPRHRQQLDIARECAESLLALLNDILDLSKVEAGRMTLERIPFDPREVMEACLKLLRPEAIKKSLALQCDVCPSVPPRLIGDPLRLRQIVLNLAGNAIKYTNQGRVHVSLKVSTFVDPQTVRLRIDVEDTGIGIPAGKLSTVFDAFTQADGSITRRYGGTGLGLAIAKQLAGLHNGRVWAESELGRGSFFHAELEIQVAGEALASRTQEPALPAAQDPPSPALRLSGRILLVEDNVVNQRVVTGMLRKRGCQVDVAGDGLEALKLLSENGYDLVLMDVQMPLLDGLETTRRLRRQEHGRNLPVIGLTAHAMDGDRRRCLEAGMNDYLPKPVRPSALCQAVAKYLGAGDGESASDSAFSQSSQASSPSQCGMSAETNPPL